MKFWYSIIIFFLNFFLFGVLYIFLIPTPKIETDARISDNATLNRFYELVQPLNVFKETPEEKVSYFEVELEDKKYNAIFLYCLLTFACIFISTILFYKRSYVIFPIIASIIFTLIACSILWLFTASIDKPIYLDLQNLRVQNSGWVNILKFTGLFLFVDLVVIIFGFWYEFPRD